MAQTVVGLFGTLGEAQRIAEYFRTAGYANTTVFANGGDDKDEINPEGKVGIGQKISNFFSGLSGGDDDVHNHYANGINNGGGLVAVTTEDDRVDTVAGILKDKGARDVDDDFDADKLGAAANTANPDRGYGRRADVDGVAATGAAAGTAAYDRGTATGYDRNTDYNRDAAAYDRNDTTTTDGQVIPVLAEDLVVGKREVNRGGVRVYSHVVSEPVSQDVTLRNERVVMERRPVDRAATAADFTSGKDSTIELNAMGEEALVGKTSRVVEEIRLGKESDTRTETVNENLRHTEVEVTELPSDDTVTTTR